MVELNDGNDGDFRLGQVKQGLRWINEAVD